MDNLRAGIKGVTFDMRELRASLAKAKIKPSIKYDEEQRILEIRFSSPVGKHRERWLFRLYPQRDYLTLSGGVTKTFFGHNLWVFNNEYEQLKAITKIVTDRLSELEGIRLPDSPSTGSFGAVVVERVELTNHFALPAGITLQEAIERLDRLFKALFPKRRDRDGDTFHDEPGTTSIGKNKSSKVCRVYPAAVKFGDAPRHMSAIAWSALVEACVRHLRIEVIMQPRDLVRLGLQSVEAWRDSSKVKSFLANKYRHYGLTVAYQTSADDLSPPEVRETNPTFVEYARHWFTDGVRGTPPNKRSGSANRFRQYMLEHGYNIKLPFAHHEYLAHGLHDYLDPAQRVVLSEDVRRHRDLFEKWWEPPPA